MACCIDLQDRGAVFLPEGVDVLIVVALEHVPAVHDATIVWTQDSEGSSVGFVDEFLPV